MGNDVGAYGKSKTLAEKAAWDFKDRTFELCTINPALIVGPGLIRSQFTSGDIIKMMMGG